MDANGQVANIFELLPDWAIEILSPGQSQSKVIRKLLHCCDRGTEMGWLLDPEDQCLFVYGADKSVRAIAEPDAPLPVPAFARAVQLTAGEVFGWLRV